MMSRHDIFPFSTDADHPLRTLEPRPGFYHRQMTEKFETNQRCLHVFIGSVLFTIILISIAIAVHIQNL